MINDEQLTFVKSMGEEYLTRYRSIRNVLRPQLVATAKIDNHKFTSHGFDHCMRILKNLDNLFENAQDDFYKKIKNEEIFLISVAQLFHDIIMTINPELRSKHSYEAKKFIRSSLEDMKKKELINVFSPLSDIETDIIADIVFAHSDFKDFDGNVLTKTLDLVKDAIHSGNSGTIHTNELCALLRFCDELDCTSARIHEAQKLSLSNDERINNPHLRRCELIREIKPTSFARNTIKLRINDLAFHESNDKPNDVDHIDFVVRKLKSSLNEVNEIIFNPTKTSWWHYCIVQLEEQSEEMIAPHRIKKIPFGDDKFDTPLSIPVLGETSTNVFDTEVSNELKKWVIERKLITSGHFEISKDRHAKDWINTSTLLEEREFLSPIVRSFVKLLRDDGYIPSKTVVIGEGFPGLILASQIAYVGGFCASYIVPKQEGLEHTDQEKKVNIGPDLDIIIVTDVIAEGITLNETLNQLSGCYKISEENIKKILTVFYRKPISNNHKNTLEAKILEKISALNTDFEIEICEKKPEFCILNNNDLVTVVNQRII